MFNYTGLGYIGLPTAAFVASKKIKVTGFDINLHVVETVNRGEIHIVEPALGSMVKQVVGDEHSGRIESTSPAMTTEKMADTIFGEHPELNDKIFVAYCPERVLPGNVLYELEYNDRVIGGINRYMLNWADASFSTQMTQIIMICAD